MTLRIYNTLCGRKEDFESLCPGQVRMYVCGVTVYDECHVGHARAYISFDVIVRYLEFCGFHVHYVRNVTDVDDKIIDKAEKEGRSVQEVSADYYRRFHRHMEMLGLRSPEAEPRATDHVPEMVNLITRLLAQGFAYEVLGDIFFEVSKFPSYGQLSKRTLEEMIAGARVEVNEKKRDPLDFALWKSAKPGEPHWDSPWGQGRPGWHIECSAMSMKHLGQTFDLHGGGQDLIFPHHENEIAQSCAATGKPLARFWVHNGFVMFKSHKMSKSLGNVFFLSKLFQQYPPALLKFFLIGKHYRSPMEFDLAEFEEARKNLERIDNTIGMAQRRLQERGMPWTGKPAQRRDAWQDSKSIGEFCDAMDDDFNTARALAVIHELLGVIHNKIRDNSPAAELAASLNELVLMLEVLGILYKPLVLTKISRGRELTARDREILLSKEGLSDEEVVALIEARNLAREKRDFATADQIRRALVAKGIDLRDEQGGTTWVRLSAKLP